jgi:hypothetical protein
MSVQRRNMGETPNLRNLPTADNAAIIVSATNRYELKALEGINGYQSPLLLTSRI